MPKRNVALGFVYPNELCNGLPTNRANGDPWFVAKAWATKHMPAFNQSVVRLSFVANDTVIIPFVLAHVHGVNRMGFVLVDCLGSYGLRHRG